MASEVIRLNLIPKGEMPVFHASQFDNGRLITCELYRGEDAYTVPEGYTVELHCRKRDNNIVTLASTLINDNVVTFTSTTQLTACHGKNLCEVAIKAADDYLIGTLNFYLEVEKDPLEGGINSTSQIHDLHDQIEDITEEIISDNYYDKTEVDDLLSAKADSDSVYTIGEVNTLLSGKANTSDVYTKSQTDTLLSAKASITYVDGEISAVDAVLIDMQTDIDRKADASDVYTKTEVDTALALKANAADVYTKQQTYTQAEVNALIDNIFPTLTASGSIASFTTALQKPLVSVTADAGATTVTLCGVNFFDDNNLVIANYPYPSMTFDKAVYLPAGTYTASISNVENATSWRFGFRFFDNTGTIITSAITNGLVTLTSAMAFSDAYDSNQTCLMAGDTNTTTVVIVLTQGAYITGCISNGNVGTTTTLDYQIETGNTASDFNAYAGNTVPVADATTLVTVSGVNNVYADSGNITVQYKYMSI